MTTKDSPLKRNEEQIVIELDAALLELVRSIRVIRKNLITLVRTERDGYGMYPHVSYPDMRTASASLNVASTELNGLIDLIRTLEYEQFYKGERI